MRRRMLSSRSAAGRAIALVAASTTAFALAGGVTLPAKASVDDPGIAELRSIVSRVGELTEGLGALGRMGEQIPAISSSAGQLVDFTTLVSEAVVTPLASIDHWDDITGSLTPSFSTGRSGTVTVAGTGDDALRTVTFALDVSRSAGQAFSFASAAPALSLSSPAGVSATARTTLTFTVAVEKIGTSYYPYLVGGSSLPSLSVKVTGEIPESPELTAAVGILGVKLKDISPEDSKDVAFNLVGSVTDPDGDGRLYQTKPDGTAGELAGAGALAGLTTIGFDPTGAGSVDLDLVLTATGGSFPGVNATVGVNWPDISAGTPTVDVTGLSSVQDFLQLSTRDLGDLLGQVSSLITAAQRDDSANKPLPFLSGKLADAVRGNEALQAFLKEFVVQQPADGSPLPPGSPAAGTPRFSSIQDLLAKLSASKKLDGTTDLLPGATISATTTGYDAVNRRLPITLTLDREITSPAPVVEETVATSAAGTYAASAVTVADVGGKKVLIPDYVGRRVVAGSSGGTIASVSTASGTSTATLLTPWTGGQPTDGTVLTVAGPTVDAGAVNLADLLQSGGQGIGDANAVRSTATVKPDYTATITFALDLRPAKTGADCDGGTGTCPYERTNADGSKLIVTSEPLPVERLLVKTGVELLSADFPVSAAIDVTARAGFLGVALGGTVKACHTSQSETCTGTATGKMLTVSLDLLPGADASGFVPVRDLYTAIAADPALVFSAVPAVRGYVSGNVSVPDAAQFLPAGATAGFTGVWNDISIGSPTMSVSDLSELTQFDVDPGNPLALLGVVIRVLQLVEDQLSEEDGPALLGTKVPVVDKSLRELLGSDEAGGGPTVTYAPVTTSDGNFTELKDTSRTGDRRFPADLIGRSVLIGTQAAVVRSINTDGNALTLASLLDPAPAAATPYFLRSELADALTLLTATPPDTLQELVSFLDARLGEDSPVSFRSVEVAGAPSLVLDVNWARDYATSAPIKLKLGEQDLAGAAAEGLASIKIAADLNLGLVVPLTGTALPSTLQVLDTSSVVVDADARLDGSLSASIGPLSVSLGKPATADPAPTDDEKAKARAHYRLGFSKPGAVAGAVSDIGSFLDTATLAVNAYDGGVDCGGDAGSTPEPLALCARLPLFVGSGTSYSKPAVNDIAVRLPKSGASVTELFSLSGDVSTTDTRDRLSGPTPEQLAEAFKNLLLDFGSIGDGLDAFLSLIEDGLKAASLEGKLPLVGGDLQAGSDFVGKLRTEMDKLFAEVETVNGGRFPTVDNVSTYLDTKFKAALTAAGANPENFDLDLVCTLAPSDVMGVTSSKDEDTTYTYAVVAIGDNAGVPAPTTIGAEGMTADGPVTLTATDKVTVTWSTQPAATGYYLLRKDGGSWKKIAETAGANSTTADDTGEPGETFDPPTTRPKVTNCTGVAMTDLQGVVLRVDIGTGTPSADQGCVDAVDRPCLGGTLPLDIGIPGLSLRAARGADAAPGGIQGKLGWRVHLALELDRTKGLSLLTDEDGTPEIAIGAKVDLTTPGTIEAPAIAAELAFLKVGISKRSGVTVPAFAAQFGVDLLDPDCTAPCSADEGRLGFADLQSADSASDVVKTALDLNVNIDWIIRADIDSALPGVQANFVLTWDKTFDPTGGEEAKGASLQIAFKDVSIDAGGFLTAVLGPIVTQIKSVTGPLKPVVDTLYAPIPVLSDLSRLAGGGDVTLVTLAKAFSTLADGPKLDFVDTVAAVIRFVNELPDPTGGSLLIPVGSFQVSGKDALATPATPDNGGNLIKAGSKKFGAPGSETADPANAALKNKINNKTQGGGVLGDASSTTAKAGFEFPLLDNPASIFNLLMGQDVDLVTFDSGDLTLGFSWRQSFGPVYAPPPVFITLSGSASVTARIKAGFDTYGIRKAFEADPDRSGFESVAQVLDGLFFFTTNDDGTPLPVITLYGEIAAGAAVSAVIITVGIEGGLSLTVAFSWNDPNGDGKFRLFEFGQVALNNPICLFQVSGRLALFLRVYITIGVSPFSVSFDFTLADITLLDFSVKPNCDPPPPRLAGSDGSTLLLTAGKFGGTGPRGDAVWSNLFGEVGDDKDDSFKVTELRDFEDGNAFLGFRVAALGITEDFLDPNLERVVVDGRGYTGKLKLTFLGDGKQDANEADKTPNATAPFTKDVIVIGGSGNDTIKAGTGNAWIDGGGGKDVITTSDGPGKTVRIAGGAGDDSITTGNASAIVAGDSTLVDPAIGNVAFNGASPAYDDLRGASTVSVSSLVDWKKLIDPDGSGTGVDKLTVGLGNNTLFGGGGNDSVGVAADSQLFTGAAGQLTDATLHSQGNTVVLGGGDDTFKGGDGDDTVWTGDKTEATRAVLDGTHGVDEAGDADPGAVLRNVVDTARGNDTVFGSAIADLISGQSKSGQADHFRGGGGKDVVVGGFGTDQLFGGPGQDWVVAEPATIGGEDGTDAFGVVRSYTKLSLPAGAAPSSKLLVGGDNEDRVTGGDGSSVLFGDRYETKPCGDPIEPVLSDPPGEPTAGTAGRDLVLGGNGIDKVKAGGEADLVRAFGAADLLCGQAGADEIFAADGADMVWGGSGNDLAYGDGDADLLFGNDGDDRLFGLGAVDTVEGNDGADDIFGGEAADLLVGGTRADDRQDAGRDEIYGEVGTDTLIGDNSNAGATYPTDLDGTSPTAGDGDFLSGGPEDDRAFGGLGNDEVNGDADRDYLEGNNAADIVRGGLEEDEIVGGSSEAAAPGTGRPDAGDTLFGDADTDVIAGDNAQILRSVDPGVTTEVLKGRGFALGHTVTLLDLGDEPVVGTSGVDDVEGGAGNDAVFGQGAGDRLKGQDGDDLVEGGPGSDRIEGGRDFDDLVGGSSTTSAADSQPDSGDIIEGDEDGDVILGDNGSLLRSGPEHPLTKGRTVARGIVLLDLGDVGDAGHYGSDFITADGGMDVVLAQGGPDYVDAGSEDDYAEGGQESDVLQGRDGQDDLVGGSYTPLSAAADGVDPAPVEAGQPDGADDVRGGADDDVLTGDNAVLLRTGRTSRVSERAGTGQKLFARHLVLLDREANGRLGLPASARFAGDNLAGGSGVDLAYGQDGDDNVSGGGGDDYLQGNGGADTLRGDVGPDGDTAETTAKAFVRGGNSSQPDVASYDDGVVQADGQDDVLGGSDVRGFRDGDDAIEGNGADDVVLGDNGAPVRTFTSGAELLYTARGAGKPTVERIADPSTEAGLTGSESTRYCVVEGSRPTCEVSGAFGDDRIFGGGGDDGLWAQDGTDYVRAGAGDDDAFGELGNDELFGDGGADVLLGDRGGVRNNIANGQSASQALSATPQESYAGVRDGTYTRRVDLQNDTNGQSWLGTGKQVTMPLNGLGAVGGRDRIRGGDGDDQVHAGPGDDLANGDTGGDELFGDDGSDAMWGGRGCDIGNAESPCTGLDLSQRGTDDVFVDHLMGGRGGDVNNAVFGADVLDWAPRGLSSTCSPTAFPVEAGTTANDPCDWFAMTDSVQGDGLANQHHHGTDWIYGGWDRDVMQADVAANGPNPGDRLIDWDGTYNLFTHCNAAYGGFNDVRQHSPGMVTFLQVLAYGMGAGQLAADASTSGTSAFRELQLGYPSDTKAHSAGKAYPSTPGHFDDPVSCTP